MTTRMSGDGPDDEQTSRRAVTLQECGHTCTVRVCVCVPLRPVERLVRVECPVICNLVFVRARGGGGVTRR